MPLITKSIIEHLSKDPFLKKAMQQVSVDSDDEPVNVFVYLVRSIISQQLSLKSAASIYDRLVHHEDIDPINPQTFIDLSNEELRSLGLSYQKAKYVKNVCLFFIEHEISPAEWEKMTDDKIIKLLTQIKGVGVWTVQMVLMFALHRPDVFPDGDLGIQQGMKNMYKIEAERKQFTKEITSISKQWAPYRTTASLYIWAFRDQIK